jgi:DNA-directed RNA polymerase specialized sigma24 family protein
MSMTNSASQTVADLLNQLTPEQREVVVLNFGLGGAEPMPLREIAAHLGLTMAQVNSRRRLALRNIRQYCRLRGETTTN